MRSKPSLSMLNLSFICTWGILFFLLLNQATCIDNSTTASPPPTTTSTTTTTPIPTPPKSDKCNIGKGSKQEENLLSNLTSIMGKSYLWSSLTDEHEYYFTVCGKAPKATDVNEGLIQINRNTSKHFVLGRLDDVDLEGILEGNYKFIRLTYKNGDDYAGSCGKTSRNAIIYIFCGDKDEFKMIEENNGRDNGQCGYVFQLYSPLMCPYLKSPCSDNSATSTTSTTATPKTDPTATSTSSNSTGSSTSPSSKSPSSPSKMGAFTIILIIMFSILSVYFVIGTLFKRYVRQVRGWEQIPNWRMWQMVGNRSMDCCNYICRCGKPRSEPNAYENIIDHASDDENLLNM